MEAIFGMRHIESGTVEILGKETHIKRPQDAINSSVGMITEDRRGNGIFGCLSIDDNTAIASTRITPIWVRSTKKKSMRS